MTGPLYDIAGHALGAPDGYVRVSSKDELCALLRDANTAGRKVVPVGLRTSYWHNLALDGCVAVDLAGMNRVSWASGDGEFLRVEAGISLRELDRALRKRGSHLGVHPDAYGDTSVGAALANGVSAGVGMLRGDFASQVLGFEAALADGSLVQAGASRSLRAQGSVAHGIAGLRSLFVGGEGALGVITEVDFSIAPSEWQAWVEVETETDEFDHAMSFARSLRGWPFPHTIRYVFEGARGQLSVQVGSPEGPEGRDRQLDTVRAKLASVGLAPARVVAASEDERHGVSPGYEAHWPGPEGATWERGRAHPFAGLDAFLPFATARECWRWASGLRVPHVAHRRLAAYAGRDGVNVGLHGVFATPEHRDEARAFFAAHMDELLALGAVPYRPGLVWAPRLVSHADPPTMRALARVAAALDPRETLSPRAGTYAVARAVAGRTPTPENADDQDS